MDEEKRDLMKRRDRMERRTRYFKLKPRLSYRSKLYDLEQRINRATTETELSQITIDTTLLERDINRIWNKERSREPERERELR